MKDKSRLITGKVYVLGDNVDTDQIIPAQYLNLVPTIPEEYERLGAHALGGLPQGHPPFIKPGQTKSEYTILIAGRNFGCGSSREHAPIALGAAGIKAVVAESYARIFFRNVIATAEFYPFETAHRLADAYRTGDEAMLGVDAARMTNAASQCTHVLKPLGAVGPVIEAGGIFAYARSTGMIRQP
jgi:3-isopropylmalate/(R)-2-methylmalate dehydratase small subunit